MQKYKIYICVHLNHIWLSDLNPDCKNTKYTCVHLNPFCSDLKKKSSESIAVVERFNTFYVVKKRIFITCEMQMRLVFGHFMYSEGVQVDLRLRFIKLFHWMMNLMTQHERKKVQRGCKPEHYILKPPFVINLLGFYLSSYIITTSHRWRGSLWCNRMHTTPFCFFWPETLTHGHKL